MNKLENLYGEFVICFCEKRGKLLKEYQEKFENVFEELAQQGKQTFYDCRYCQWQRFINDPKKEKTYRID